MRMRKFSKSVIHFPENNTGRFHSMQYFCFILVFLCQIISPNLNENCRIIFLVSQISDILSTCKGLVHVAMLWGSYMVPCRDTCEILPGPPSLTRINFNPSMDKWLHLFWYMEWTYSSIPKLQRSTVEVWECISDFIPHFIRHVVTYPYWD